MEALNNVRRQWETEWVTERIRVYDRLLEYHPMSPLVKQRVIDTRRIFKAFNDNPQQNGIMTLDDLRRLDVKVDVRFARLYEDAATPTTLSKEIEDLKEFLSNMLLDEYLTGKVTRAEGDKKWMQRGMYLNAWGTDHPQDALRGLSKELGISVDDVEGLCGVKMQEIIKLSGLGSQYVVQRLQAYARDESWVTANQQLAKLQQWKELATRLLDDQKHLEELVPGNFEYVDPNVKGSRTNRKGRIRIGMIRTQATYFSRLTSPDSFKLSKQVRKWLKVGEKTRKRDAKAQAKMRKTYEAKQRSRGIQDAENAEPKMTEKTPGINLRRVGKALVPCLSLVGDIVRRMS